MKQTRLEILRRVKRNLARVARIIAAQGKALAAVEKRCG